MELPRCFYGKRFRGLKKKSSAPPVRNLDEKQIEDEFSQSWIIYELLTHETKPCTLWELENVYSLKQAYMMLEVIKVYDARKQIAYDKAEALRIKNQKG